MADNKKEISEEDIEAKSVGRRRFMLGAAGTVVVASSAATSGCGLLYSDTCDSDTGDSGATWDADSYDTTTTYDYDSGNSCDSD